MQKGDSLGLAVDNCPIVAVGCLGVLGMTDAKLTNIGVEQLGLQGRIIDQCVEGGLRCAMTCTDMHIPEAGDIVGLAQQIANGLADLIGIAEIVVGGHIAAVGLRHGLHLRLQG